jgi:hypothetical protein
MINKTVIALASIMAASASFAGGLSPVVVEDVPVVEDKPASSVSPLLILGLLVLIGVLVSRNNDDDEDTQPTPSDSGPIGSSNT